MPKIYLNLRLILIIYILKINTVNEDLKKLVQEECVRKKEEIRNKAHQTIDELFVGDDVGIKKNFNDENKKLNDENEILKEENQRLKNENDKLTKTRGQEKEPDEKGGGVVEDSNNSVSDVSEEKKEENFSIFSEVFLNLFLIIFIIFSFTIILYLYYKIIEGLGLILREN